MRNIIGIMLLLGIAVANSQNLEIDWTEIFTRDQHFWEFQDRFSEAQKLIPGYYYKNEMDSIEAIFDYFEENSCSEYFYALKTLLDIEKKQFIDDWCQHRGTYHLFSGGTWSPCSSSPSDYSMATEGIFDKAYYKFQRELAAKLSEKVNRDSLEYLVCKYYAEDFETALNLLKTNSYPGTCIQNAYDESEKTKKSAIEKLMEGD